MRLVGPQTQAEIALRLAHATIFVLPCTREADGGMDNLPTVIMEAMAAGLPVISTPLAGVPEMVEHEVNGELVPEHDPAAICAAMERLISDPRAGAEIRRPRPADRAGKILHRDKRAAVASGFLKASRATRACRR